MFHDPLVAFNEHVPYSITSMVPSKFWSIHFPLLFVATTLLTHGPVWFGLDVGWGDTFFFSNAYWSNMFEYCLWKTFKSMIIV
jgi:hypothetical protein